MTSVHEISARVLDRLLERDGAWCEVDAELDGDAAEVITKLLSKLKNLERINAEVGVYSMTQIRLNITSLEAAEARALKAEKERDEMASHATAWSSLADTICTILGLGVLDYDKIAEAVRSKFEAKEALVAEAKADAKASFNHGVIFAAYHAARAHGEDTIAKELLSHIGIETVKELKSAGGQTCDVQALRHLLKRARS